MKSEMRRQVQTILHLKLLSDIGFPEKNCHTFRGNNETLEEREFAKGFFFLLSTMCGVLCEAASA